MIFIKVFLSAVFLFAFFNAYAQPITGAFGYKFGQYIPSWEGAGWSKVDDFKDNLFDELSIAALPKSKKLYRIDAQKILTRCDDSDEFEALTQILRDKYPGPYKLDPRLQYMAGSGFTRENDGKRVSLSCVNSFMKLVYEDLELKKKVKEELQSIKQEKVEALKEKIDASKL